MAVGCAASELLHLFPELSPAPALSPPAPWGQVVPQKLSSRGAMQEPIWVGFASFQVFAQADWL